VLTSDPDPDFLLYYKSCSQRNNIKIMPIKNVAVLLVVIMMMGSGEVSMKGSLQVSTELTIELSQGR
jgi:hypothetical protein